MSFTQLLLILHARRKLFAVTLATLLLLTLAASLLLPKTYKASATVVLNPGIDPVTGQALPGQLVPSYLATQVGILQSQGLALKVVEELRLSQREWLHDKYMSASHGQGSENNWIADYLVKHLDVKPTRESNVIELSYGDREAQWSADIANAYARIYQRTNMELRLEPAKRATGYFHDQVRTQRAALENAQQRMSAYQKEKGIANVDEKLDVESLRLKELTTQLVTVQSQLMDADSKKRASSGDGGAESSDVLANPMIQNLRVNLAAAEAKLAQAAERYTPAHPHYQEAQAEVNRLRAQLQSNSKSAATGFSRSASAARQRERELQAAVTAQKERVLELNRARDELTIMAREVESQQKAYDLLLQKQAAASVEGQSGQSEVTLLSTAVAPIKPAFPILWLNLAIALVAGTLLGIGLALLAEVRDRRVRTSQDLVDALDAPVLASLRLGPGPRKPLPGPTWRLPQPAQ